MSADALTTPAGAGPLNIHATALVVGEAGVLVRGPAGAGKTRLALVLVGAARARGRFARLVADDRALIEPRGGRLLARPHPALAGLAERRGLGVARVPHEPACVVRLAVDLVPGWPERVPAPGARRCEIAGIAIERLAVPLALPAAEAAAMVWASEALSGAPGGPDAPSPCHSRRDAQDCAGAEQSSRQSSRHGHER